MVLYVNLMYNSGVPFNQFTYYLIIKGSFMNNNVNHVYKALQLMKNQNIKMKLTHYHLLLNGLLLREDFSSVDIILNDMSSNKSELH
eukprot:Pgem_evm2s337